MPVPRFTSSGAHPFDGPSKLFNVRTDPGQLNELTEPETETLMISLLKDSLQEAHAPEEVTQRLGLSGQETL
jgi:hypothetical protein